MKTISYTVEENVRKLSDAKLISQTEFLAQEHRKNTVLLLRHLREVEVRRLFVEMKCTSMHKYCIQRLKFSEGETQRRLSAARLLKDLPEIQERIESGDLNLTNLSRVQSFLKTEKNADHALDKNAKLELLQKMENKSAREVERELIGLSHQPALMCEKFNTSAEAAGLTGLEFSKFEALLDHKQSELLTEFRNLFAHELTDHANGAVLVFLLEKAVNFKKKKLGLLKKEPTKKNNTSATVPRPVSKNAAPPPSVPKATQDLLPKDCFYQQSAQQGPRKNTNLKPPLRTTVRIWIQKQLWQRAGSCCEHRDPESGARCTSRFALEIDHIQPVALGGTNNIVNLRLLCRAHNSRRAIHTFHH